MPYVRRTSALIDMASDWHRPALQWLRRRLLGLLAGLAVLVLAVRLFLTQVPERFRLGAELGEVVSDAMLAYLTAYAFQLLVVEWPRRRKEQEAVLKVDRQVQAIAVSAKGIPQRLLHSVPQEERAALEDPTDLREVMRRMRWDAPDGEFVVLESDGQGGQIGTDQYLTILQSLQKTASDCEYSLSKVSRFHAFLNGDQVFALETIATSTFLNNSPKYGVAFMRSTAYFEVMEYLIACDVLPEVFDLDAAERRHRRRRERARAQVAERLNSRTD